MMKKKIRRGPSPAGVLTNFVVAYLGSRGHLVWRNNTTGVFDPSSGRFRMNPKIRRGVADVIGLTKEGIHLEVEIKIGRDRMSLFQDNHAKEIIRRSGIYIVAKTIDGFQSDARRFGL